MVTGAERALIVRLAASCPRLNDERLTSATAAHWKSLDMGPFL